MKKHWKILVVAALFALGITIIALAEPTTNAPSVTLAWDQTSDTSVNGYRVYWGVAPRTYTNHVTVNSRFTTTAAVTNLVRATTYYFAATCTATNGLESAYSTEVTYTTTPIPGAPVNVKATTLTP